MSTVANMAKVPELRKRILFTLGMLAVYRLGVHVPSPGIDAAELAKFFSDKGDTILGVFNVFSGGALERLSIFALGIMPYISASIIMQLLAPTIPYLERLKKEGELGQRKITQYSRYLTIVISCVQGFGLAAYFQSQGVVINPGLAFKIQTVITLAAGTAFLMWLGEQITERGIGNGISLIIYAGIVAGLPGAISNTVTLVQENQMAVLSLIFMCVFMAAVIYGIVYVEQAYRRVPVQVAKRVVGRKVFQGQNTGIPIKVNSAGVMAAIFAMAIISGPISLARLSNIPWLQRFSQQYLSFDGWITNVIMVVLIIFFFFFYTAIQDQTNPEKIAENIKKSGGYIPGIRPGRATADYLEKVIVRIAFVGAIYTCLVCVLPGILQSNAGVSFYFGGTSLLIVVGVALDTMQQIQAHLVSHDYDAMMGGNVRGRKLKGRRAG
ncbi:preprotein translocase subunit SecY [bacterium]|nr:preprotein translocase subunit SecY [bacterium]